MFLPSKTLLVAAALVATVLYVGDPYAPENADMHAYLPELPDNTDQYLGTLRTSLAKADTALREQTLWEDFTRHELTRDILNWTRQTSSELLAKIRRYREDQQVVADLQALRR
ncbi:hypothetical protein Q4485_01225 [Granulosicoccaceae sp. 1_MG-2023]|nr:hypothetical protein [Granulosicoccaceae sp. 1_MG-2023]